MPIKGSTVFLRFPGETQRRILHTTTVTQTMGSDNLTVTPEDQTLKLEAGQELLIYFEHRRQFMQQPARVEALLEGEAGPVFAIQTLGEPMSAESRQCYRVSTAISDLTASFGGEDGCPLRDVSVTGFAVIASGRYKTGEVVDAELSFEGRRYTGKVSIQGVCEATDGRYRYGVNCVKMMESAQSLSKGLQQISMSVQRQQLNRLAGGA